ncbi:hypothetical protein GCM10023336_51950 [Streptomyces similanensis]|uniref:Uncharacterized protein n=1 Tax=Streptomyces similanensis TaxID=1274988 RepID=A0ABP9L3G6_9ACTN
MQDPLRGRWATPAEDEGAKPGAHRVSPRPAPPVTLPPVARGRGLPGVALVHAHQIPKNTIP